MEKREKHIEVFSYSGYKANERPLSFVLGEETLRVKKIVKRWRGEDHDYFRVLADDGEAYLLKWNRNQDHWTLSGLDFST